jgi:hypothetical protein
MTTDKRNLEETNKSEWRNETKEAGRRLDNLIETAEDKPYAYILIAVENDSEGTNIGVQVNGTGLLLAQGLASFLAKDDYAPLIQMANYFAAMGLMDEPNEAPDDDELSNEVTAFLRSIFGGK